MDSGAPLACNDVVGSSPTTQERDPAAGGRAVAFVVQIQVGTVSSLGVSVSIALFCVIS